MKKRQSTERGSTLVVLVFVLVITLVGVLGWLAWQNMAPKSKSESSQSTQAVKSNDGSDKFLVVKEWGVKLPLSDDTKGISYDYKLTGNISSITLKSPLVKPCDSGLGFIVRGQEGAVYYTAPDGTDVSFNANEHKVGDYYYVYRSPQAPCSDDGDTAGIKKEADIVKALEAATQNIIAN